jgi:hypothetical protein
MSRKDKSSANFTDEFFSLIVDPLLISSRETLQTHYLKRPGAGKTWALIVQMD